MTLYLHKKPQPPMELKVLNSLRSRMNLSPYEKQNYENLRKGYIGELRFHDFLSQKLPPNHLLLNSFRLRSNNSEFQLDSLLFHQNTIYLFEVKNFEGDFYIQGNNWYVSPTGKEINNPLIQLKRSESLLRQAIQQSGYTFLVEPYIIFINSEFALFQAPMNLPIVLPAQLNRFFNNIIANPSNLTETHNKFANLLAKKHIEKSAHDRIPEYNYNQLKKGLKCKSCARFLSYSNKIHLICQHCKSKEVIESAVIRNVEEFNFLFPNQRITNSLIYEWCGIIPSQKTIRRILSNYLVPVPEGRNSYYIFKDKSY